ncbi:MAG: GTPase Era [bacterium]|nr:GTPase Era [bacterium]
MSGKKRKPERAPKHPPLSAESGRELDLAEILGRAEEPGAVPEGHRSGFVSIIGRPNIGKSTLLNRILGEKIAIVTRKPGTTRRRLLGVHTTEAAQIVFFDTPGIERPTSKLGRFLLEEIKAACVGADLVLFMTDGREEDADLQALTLLDQSGAPHFLLINKIDAMKQENLLPMIERFSRGGKFEEYVPISALKGTNVDRLLETVRKHLPEGPRYFPPGTLSDISEQRLIEEFVREQVYRQVHEEVPYAVAVRVQEMERDEETGFLRAEAVIFVERKSQRGILVGKRGERIKALGQAARAEIEARLGGQMFLGLQVRIKPNWRQLDAALKELGYGPD